MKYQKLLLPAILLINISMLSSCKKNATPAYAPPSNAKGVYVVNEGAFGSGNSSVSFIDTKTGTMFNDLFENVNGFPLGDLAQSMTIHNEKGYIVVNVSQKIEVVNIENFSSLATITGFQGPRYMVMRGNKGYVSDWFSNSVKVINLSSNSITNSINVGAGPDQMIISGNKLFVTNVGGWANDSTVSVINLDTESVISTIQVGLNPNSLKIDKNGKLWVLCGGTTGPDFIGGTADDIAGSLWKIDPSTFSTELSMVMNSENHPSKLQITGDGNELFYLQGTDGYTGKVEKMAITSSSLPSGFIIDKEFYGLGIDPINANIYGGFAPGFSQNGYVFRYSSSALLIDSLQAGIAPNGFCFR